MKNIKKTVAVAGLAAAAAMGLSLTTARHRVGRTGRSRRAAAYAAQVPTGPGSVAGMAQDPVAVAASNNPMLTTLTKAVSGQLNPDVNLVDTLNGGEFTVFAPTDAAFAKIDPATIEKLKTDSPSAHEDPDLPRGSRARPARRRSSARTRPCRAPTSRSPAWAATSRSTTRRWCAAASRPPTRTVYMIDTVLMPPAN